jgi:hypothetical protein
MLLEYIFSVLNYLTIIKLAEYLTLLSLYIRIAHSARDPGPMARKSFSFYIFFLYAMTSYAYWSGTS